MNGTIDEFTDEKKDERMHEQMIEQNNKRMSWWIDELVNLWVDE